MPATEILLLAMNDGSGGSSSEILRGGKTVKSRVLENDTFQWKNQQLKNPYSTVTIKTSFACI